MQRVVSKGKTLSEAIESGLAILGVTKEEVDIEVIRQAERKLWGLKSVPATVRLSTNESGRTATDEPAPKLSTEELLEQILEETPDGIDEDSTAVLLPSGSSSAHGPDDGTLAGKAWVRSGQLFCRDSPDHYPTVTVGEGIRFYKNDQLIENDISIVSEKDDTRIEAVDVEVETAWKLEMDKEKLKVSLNVEPGYRISRTLADTEPAPHLKLTPEEKRETMNTLSTEQVLYKLGALHVNRGINQVALMKAAVATEPGIFDIAEGSPAKDGKDGWFEPLLNLDASDTLKEDEDGRIDYRETKTIPNVTKGDVIGFIHPPVPGKIGQTVTGEPLLPRQARPLTVKWGSGVTESDNKIVATASGRPHLEKRGHYLLVSVVPKLVHRKNVDLSSGNIHFKGDVEVHGNVEEGMLVEAEGEVTIRQTTNGAVITTSGAFRSYGNVVGSKISAGKNNMLVTELGRLLGTLHRYSEQMIATIRQLERSPSFSAEDLARTGLQPLIRVLLEKNFKNFSGLIKQYNEIVSRGEKFLVDERWKNVSHRLSALFLSLSVEKISLESLVDLAGQMEELHELSETAVEPDSFISLPMVLNSTLYCSGNIRITGKGCVNTKIHSGGKVEISKILRGGTVYGGLGVSVTETGAESGTKTTIAVPADQRITVKLGREGTVLQFGNYKHVLQETRENIVAYLNENGQVVIR